MARLVCDNRGFAALASVLAAGALAATTATLLLFFGSDFSRAVLSVQESYEAKALARACADTALLQVHNNVSYTGSGSLSLGQGSCTYLVTNTGPTSREVQATGTVGDVEKRMEIIISRLIPRITISSWQDVNGF